VRVKEMNNSEWKKLFLERLLRFSVRIVLYANMLPKTPAGFAIAAQVVKSGTSIGANFSEAQDASSLKDFIQKLSISLREARETYYWLRVINETGLLSQSDKDMDECNEIIAVLTSIIKSSKSKLNE
jgi:four helix bundle protein